MSDKDTQNPNEAPEKPDSWGRFAFKHVTGMGIGTVIGAGVGAASGAIAKKGNATIGGMIGLLASLGFGNVIYNMTVGQFEKKPSFADKITAERNTVASKER